MAWGRSAHQEPSTLRQILPLIILIIILGVAAVIGYHVYVGVTKIQETASKKIGDKNVVFTKDGVRVGVKHVENEQYVDSTQGWVVKAWNLGSSAKEAEKEQKKHKKQK